VTTQQIIKRGARLVELLNQEPSKPFSSELEFTLLFAGRNGFLDTLSIPQVLDFKSTILEWFEEPEQTLAMENLYELDNEITRDLVLKDFITEIVELVRE
jgi:F-type H+-transporting ATPase subunit alpha